MDSLEKIKKDFKEITKVIDSTLGEKYSSKNPGLVQHLMNNVQQQEDREVHKNIHKP